MARITYVMILGGIKTTLLTSALLQVAQDAAAGEITPKIPETPLLQIYPEAGDPTNITFQGSAQQQTATINADLFVRQRSFIAQDLDTLVDHLDAMELVLELEETKGEQADPYFGVLDDAGNVAIKAFGWRWERVVFNYAKLDYVGIRYSLELVIY